MFADSIDAAVSSGVFLAELQGAARALNALPYTWQVQLVLDSESAITAVQSYMAEVSERKRMRMQGRPLLALIARMVESRQQLAAAPGCPSRMSSHMQQVAAADQQMRG